MVEMTWKAFRLAYKLSLVTIVGILSLVIFASAGAVIGIVFGVIWVSLMTYIYISTYSNVKLIKEG